MAFSVVDNFIEEKKSERQYDLHAWHLVCIFLLLVNSYVMWTLTVLV